MQFAALEPMTFGKKLEDELKILGLSNAALAEKLEDTSASTVGNYIKGKTYPPLNVAIQIAKITGCSLDWLADDELNEKPGPPQSSPEEVMIREAIDRHGIRTVLRIIWDAEKGAEPLSGPYLNRGGKPDPPPTPGLKTRKKHKPDHQGT